VRIGVVTTSYPRFAGDPSGGFVAEQVAWLEGRGHEVEVVAAGQPGAAEARIARVDGGALFYGGGAPEALQGARAWAAAGMFTAKMAREVARRGRRWDAAVCHWLVPAAVVARLVLPRRIPLLAVAHSGDVHLLRRVGALGPVAGLLARSGVRLSFVSQELEGMFLAAAPRLCRAGLAARSQVCPMGVEVARLRAARVAVEGSPTVAFVGRLVPVKGAKVLLEAARRWQCGARLVIAGEGPEEAALRREAGGEVEVVGPVHGAERDRLLGRSQIVAVPSVTVEGGRTEGMPVVALEAMAAGAAVVASAVGGLAEIPAEAISRVPPGDPIALAAAVDRLVLDPGRRTSQLRAQERFVSQLDWSVVGPRLDPSGPCPDEHGFSFA
jgi:glycosyltransferase involved in cell wall biosynthesis